MTVTAIEIVVETMIVTDFNSKIKVLQGCSAPLFAFGDAEITDERETIPKKVQIKKNKRWFTRLFFLCSFRLLFSKPR